MIDKLTEIYDAYVDGYRDANGVLPVMMHLKRVHTDKVVRNAQAIAQGEEFPDELAQAVAIAALLHDTGRYEQLAKYNTFRDSESVDHAVFSHDIVEEKGWLDGYERKNAVLDAVLFHNRRELPSGLDPFTLACSKTVRDADKLDIFRVLEDQIENTDWHHDSRAFWNLAVSAPPNPEVVGCIERGESVDYQAIKSLSDFVLIQVGWMISGLEYATSRRLCRERGHLEYRRVFLKTLSSDPAIDRICDLAKNTANASKIPSPR